MSAANKRSKVVEAVRLIAVRAAVDFDIGAQARSGLNEARVLVPRLPSRRCRIW